MKRQLLTCCLAICSLATMAQHDEWKNPEINAVNRAPMHTNYFAYSSSEEAAKADKENSSNFLTLNGIWMRVRPISTGLTITTKDGDK